ncbi:MAG: MBL fold metallo-hydrolase [Acidobacteriota bacterium]
MLTFSAEGKRDFDMMIDCGLLVGTKNGDAIMQAVAADIKQNLAAKEKVDGKEPIDVVVLTHEHADHISGFTQAQAIFDQIHLGEFWAGWVDDVNNPNYQAVRDRFKKQITGLKAAVAKMSNDQQSLKDTINALTNEFFMDDVLGANGSTTGRSPAWDYVTDKSASQRYFSPGDMIEIPGFEDLRIYVLGPPEDFETFTRVDPPSDETYRDKGSNFTLADSFFAAVTPSADSLTGELCQPFEGHLRIEIDRAADDDFFENRYGFAENAPNQWRRINDDWLSIAGGLALNLDSYTNNTCLALAIEFVKSGKVLLFPGDAQFANWISWQKLLWQIPDGTGGKRTVKTEDLLNQTVFYKVGHHGSHNATLKTHGLEMMTNSELIAMIPVSRTKAKSKKWEMPEENLLNRLVARTRGRVIFADESDITALESRSLDPDFTAKVKFGDKTLVRDQDNPEVLEPIYVEFTIAG